MFQHAILALMLVLSASLVGTIVRLVRGPSVADQAMAFDLMMMHIAGLITLYAILSRMLPLLDVIIIVAVAGFLSTVAIARYMEEGRQ